MPPATHQQHNMTGVSGSFPARLEAASASAAQPAFANPFALDDLLALDNETLGSLLTEFGRQHSVETLAFALTDAPTEVFANAHNALPISWRERLHRIQYDAQPSAQAIANARQCLLDACFWELTYWKTPQLYEALTEGERIHPGVFRRLAPWLADATVLDAGAGAGRATFACLSGGARRVYAVEPSPGLLRILNRKIAQAGMTEQAAGGSVSTEQPVPIIPVRGRFEHIPLPDHSVDISLSCSAFTAEPAHGGERGLAELLRVTRPGGQIAVIWPRPADYAWLAAHGFIYVGVPTRRPMAIHFRTRKLALACAHHFYAHRPAVIRYLEEHQTCELPFSVLGVNPPNDYCWRLA